jgi:ATP phosphoribosyltransferase
MTTVRVAVPRKGRPLEAVLERLATVSGIEDLADSIASTLRYEKAVTKNIQTAEGDVYDRLATYSSTDRYAPEYTLLRDSRPDVPRRIVFDSLRVDLGDDELHLVGREEPFRALRKHEFALGFDSADLVLEEVVGIEPEPLSSLEELNARIDPRDTDVRVAAGLDDTVHHTLLSTPDVAQSPTRALLDEYEGPLCISPRYERLVEAVLGTDVIEGVSFRYPGNREAEAAIASVGIGVYLTVTGSTARDHGLRVGEKLFPSETVLLENIAERDERTAAVTDVLAGEIGTIA